jgi:hypothetical protein
MSEHLDIIAEENWIPTKAVEFEAEVWQVKTMADGSVNVVLKLPEYCMAQAKELMGWHHLLVRCIAALENENKDYGL